MMALRNRLDPDLAGLFGIEAAGSYTSSPDEDYEAGLQSAKAMQVLRVRFLVAWPRALSAASAERSGLRRINPGFWLGDRGMQLDASLLGRAYVAANRAAALNLIDDPSFEPRRDAVLLAGPGVRPLDAGGFPRGQGSLVKKDLGPERARYEVDSPHEALLLTSTHFDPGWRATIDGAPAPVLRADLMVNGLFVPAGRHAVELRFWPVGLTSGLAAFAATVGACVAAAVIKKKRP